jgi:hypothetical protein
VGSQFWDLDFTQGGFTVAFGHRHPLVLFKTLEVVVNTLDMKERKLETNMSLYFKIMEVWIWDINPNRPSNLACHYFIVIQKNVSHGDDSKRALNISLVKI